MRWVKVVGVEAAAVVLVAAEGVGQDGWAAPLPQGRAATVSVPVVGIA